MKLTPLLLIATLSLAPGSAVRGQAVPPLSYVCTMAGDEDVIEDAPGRCRKCGMELKPIRLDSIWTCPVHAVVAESKPGTCPIDKRDLVQVTVAVAWTCAGTTVESLNPGTCKDGSPMTRKLMPRPHGNHNPQHGGVFFMAPDNWHHIEGTYPRAGVFRMYLYDDFTKPLAREEFQKIGGRLEPRNGAPIPLAPTPGGHYLEAKIDTAVLPLEIAAKVHFKPGGPEHHFDFTFPEYSKEPAAPAAATTAAAVRRPPPAAAPPVSAPAPAPAPTPAPAPAASAPRAAAPLSATVTDLELLPQPIPSGVPELLTQLAQRTQQIRRLIDQGAFGSVYLPAFNAKDLALALGQHTSDLPPQRQKAAAPAIKRLVRSAWMLDAFGDLGNRAQITEAYQQFADAVRDVEAAFPEHP